MEHTDVCFAPVLTMGEAAQHPHNVARGTFIEVAGVTQPAPAPRFSRTEPEVVSAPAHPGQHSRAVLADWGIAADRIEVLRRQRRGRRRRSRRRLIDSPEWEHSSASTHTPTTRASPPVAPSRALSPRGIGWCWSSPPTAITARCPTTSRRARRWCTAGWPRPSVVRRCSACTGWRGSGTPTAA